MNHMDGASFLSQMPENVTPQQINQYATQYLSRLHEDNAMLDQNHPQAPDQSGPTPEQQAANPSQETQPVNLVPMHHGQPPAQAPAEQSASPGVATGLPMGYAANQQKRQEHYLDVQNAANEVPRENAVLNNIYDISKSGAPTGTLIGQIYKSLASTGLAPDGIQDPAEQLRLIQSHAAQLATESGMPGTNEKLHALMDAKVGDKDLPKVIQTMVPYLIAVNDSKVARSKFYQKKAGDGTNPDTVAEAQSLWNEKFDPRLMEMKFFANDPKELNRFLGEMPKKDRATMLEKYKEARKLGFLE